MNGLFDISSPRKRERLLLVIAGALFLVIVIPVFYHLFGGEITKLRSRRNQLSGQLEKLESEVERQAEIRKRLTDLYSRSLPPGDLLAQSLYQNWLIDMATDVGIRDKRIDPGSIAPMKDQYKKYTFTLHGKGSLEQIAEFLRRFHKAGYLHLVRKVTPRPIRASNELEVSITVEALALPQAKPTRMLPRRSESEMAPTETEKTMLRDITQRNLFASYVPPRPAGEAPPPVKEDDFDQAPYCFVTAIVEVDGKFQVWVDLRTEGKRFKLHEGDMFRLGGVRCFVKKIEFDRVQFEAAGGLYTVKIGQSFAEYE